jgi:hypothetical protein
MTENLHQQCVLELEREKSLSKSLGESLSETKRRLAQLQLESEALQKQIKELLGQLSARRVNDEDLKDAEARAIQTLADAKRVYESDIARVRSECEAKTENSLKLLRSESVRDKALVEELKKQLARAGASKGKEADQKSEAIIAQKNEILLLQRQLAESMQAAATIASQQSTEIAALRKQLASAREAEAALRVASADLEQRATHLSRNLSDATRQLEDANAALQADRKAAAEQEAIRSKREAGLEKQHAKDLMELAALKASVDEQASDAAELKALRAQLANLSSAASTTGPNSRGAASAEPAVDASRNTNNSTGRKGGDSDDDAKLLAVASILSSYPADHPYYSTPCLHRSRS